MKKQGAGKLLVHHKELLSDRLSTIVTKTTKHWKALHCVLEVGGRERCSRWRQQTDGGAPTIQSQLCHCQTPPWKPPWSVINEMPPAGLSKYWICVQPATYRLSKHMFSLLPTNAKCAEAGLCTRKCTVQNWSSKVFLRSFPGGYENSSN